MWPGEQQPGGQQNPQWSNPQGPPQPPAAPGYPQQQPGFGPAYGYPQGQGPGYQPGQPTVPLQQGQWGPPPVGPKPPGNRKNVTMGVAIAASVAVVAAGIGAVYLLQGDKKKTTASPSASSSVSPSASSAAPSATGSAAPSGDDPHGGSNATVQPVVAGWKAVPRGDRHAAFDVPSDWAVQSQDTEIGFEDAKGNAAIIMGGAAIYKQNYCDKTNMAGAGTKGAVGAKSLQDAAEGAAENWAYYGFNDVKNDKKGKLSLTKSGSFTNSHGIKGYLAVATETNEPKSTKCSTDGAGYAIAWVGPNNQTTVWCMYTSTGVAGEVSAQTIDTIEQSIRQIQ